MSQFDYADVARRREDHKSQRLYLASVPTDALLAELGRRVPSSGYTTTEFDRQTRIITINGKPLKFVESHWAIIQYVREAFPGGRLLKEIATYLGISQLATSKRIERIRKITPDLLAHTYTRRGEIVYLLRTGERIPWVPS